MATLQEIEEEGALFVTDTIRRKCKRNIPDKCLLLIQIMMLHWDMTYDRMTMLSTKLPDELTKEEPIIENIHPNSCWIQYCMGYYSIGYIKNQTLKSIPLPNDVVDTLTRISYYDMSSDRYFPYSTRSLKKNVKTCLWPGETMHSLRQYYSDVSNNIYL